MGVARVLAFRRSLLVSTVCAEASLPLVGLQCNLFSTNSCHMSFLATTLKRSLGRPTDLFSCTGSPYKRCLGMRPSSIRCTWPIHRRRLWRRRGYTEGMPALSKTALFVMRSFQEMERMRRKQRGWNTFRRFSCAACVVQDSLPLRSMLMMQVL